MKKLFIAVLLLLIISVNAVSAELWASSKSNKYHYPNCKWAQKINANNLVVFKSPEDAIKAGYIPCKFVSLLWLLNSLAFAQDFCVCTKVIDGDTIIADIDGKEERIRLIGVDTPETVHPNKTVEHFGKEASAFTKSMVEGKRINGDFKENVAKNTD